MNDLVDCGTSVSEWLSAAAARRPAPGGGSVAALVGALSAAMGEMTLNFTAGRKGNTAEQEARVAAELAALERARKLMLTLMEEDQAAFAALTAARRLDDAAPGRQQTLDTAHAAAVAVPEAIMAVAAGVLIAASRVAPDANPWLLSDLEVCGELALATVRCGRYNVRANLSDLGPGVAARLNAECDALVRRGVGHLVALLAAIEARRS